MSKNTSNNPRDDRRFGGNGNGRSHNGNGNNGRTGNQPTQKVFDPAAELEFLTRAIKAQNSVLKTNAAIGCPRASFVTKQMLDEQHDLWAKALPAFKNMVDNMASAENAFGFTAEDIQQAAVAIRARLTANYRDYNSYPVVMLKQTMEEINAWFATVRSESEMRALITGDPSFQKVMLRMGQLKSSVAQYESVTPHGQPSQRGMITLDAFLSLQEEVLTTYAALKKAYNKAKGIVEEPAPAAEAPADEPQTSEEPSGEDLQVTKVMDTLIADAATSVTSADADQATEEPSAAAEAPADGPKASSDEPAPAAAEEMVIRIEM